MLSSRGLHACPYLWPDTHTAWPQCLCRIATAVLSLSLSMRMHPTAMLRHVMGLHDSLIDRRAVEATAATLPCLACKPGDTAPRCISPRWGTSLRNRAGCMKRAQPCIHPCVALGGEHGVHGGMHACMSDPGQVPGDACRHAVLHQRHHVTRKTLISWTAGRQTCARGQCVQAGDQNALWCMHATDL